MPTVSPNVALQVAHDPETIHSLVCGSPRCSISAWTPYERADITSNTYWDWEIDHAYLLVPAQAYVGQYLATFKDYPQRQKADSFNLDAVLRSLQESGGSK